MTFTLKPLKKKTYYLHIDEVEYRFNCEKNVEL